jgi:hypothetical protein
MVTIQGSKVNIVMGGGERNLIDHPIALRFLFLTMNKKFHVTPKFCEANGHEYDLDVEIVSY